MTSLPARCPGEQVASRNSDAGAAIEPLANDRPGADPGDGNEAGLQEPLLPTLNGSGSLGAGSNSGMCLLLPAASESKRILVLAAPLIAEELLAYGSTLIAIAMVGRLGAIPLSVFALARSVTNITGVALLNGLTGAIDTYGSQAHGSRTFEAVGVVLQRALILSLLASAPLMLLYAGIHPVLLVLGQEARLAAAAARYIHLFAPAVALHAITLCLFRTLASQGASLHVLAAGSVFFLVTAPFNWLFIFHLGWGLDGSALAAVAAEAVYVACLVAMCALHNRQQAPEARWWRGWRRQALQDWAPFLKLSSAAAAMIVLDWWAYDINTLLAGLLPNPDVPVAATGIVYNINTIVFMVPFGLSFAVCARVGHHLGSAKPRTAKLAADIGTAIGLVVAGIPSLLLLLSRGRAAALFTTDSAVIQACSDLMLPLAALLLSNGATALLSGTLRGCGRQQYGAWVNGTANYGIGLPLQLLLAFRLGGGVAGLWWGLATASCLQALVLAVLVSRFDWCREACRAAKLVRHMSKALSSVAEELGPVQDEGSEAGPDLVPVPPLI